MNHQPTYYAKARQGKKSPFKRLAFIIRRITLEADLAATRFSLALAETFWAFNLFFSKDAMQAEKYYVMAQTMGQAEWGFVFAVISLMQWSILVSGRYHGSAAAAFAGVSAFLWWYIIIGLLTSSGSLPVAIGSEIALGCAAGWVLIRTGVDRFDTQWALLKSQGAHHGRR